MIEIIEDEDLLAAEDEATETDDVIMIQRGKNIAFIPYVEELNIEINKEM